MLKSAVAALAAMALSAAAAAQQAQRVCISQAENEAVVSYLMPELLDGLSEQCAAYLPRSSFLVDQAGGLERGLEPLAERSWPQAHAVMERVGGNPIPDRGPAGAVAKNAIAAGAAGAIAEGFDADGCRVADRLLEKLAPLPPANLAAIMALFLELGIAENDEVPFLVCRS